MVEKQKETEDIELQVEQNCAESALCSYAPSHKHA